MKRSGVKKASSESATCRSKAKAGHAQNKKIKPDNLISVQSKIKKRI